jgi:predicted enzyme related to lactoylglutathione lyase
MSKRKKTTSKKSTLVKNQSINKNGEILSSERSNSDIKTLYSKDIVYYHLAVNDFDKMKDFYKNVMEFEVGGEAPPEYGWCDFLLPVKGARLGLLRTDKVLKNEEAAPSINVSVGNLEEAYKIMKAKNVPVMEIEDIPDMISMFDIKDPEGNRISFLGDPRISTKH